MSIFEFVDYKKATRAWLKSQPKEGRGLLSRMAEEAQLSPAMITQILNGDKHLSSEAAFAIAQFMGLSEDETHYYLLLVQKERAGTHQLRESLNRKILAEQKKAAEIVNKLRPDRELDEKTKLQFYSDWVYSGIRNMVACSQFENVDQIAEHLKLPRPVVQRVVDFLVRENLCEFKAGKLKVGSQVTHVGHDHPLVQQHHKNWRLQAMTKMTAKDDDNLFFTAPMSLSQEDAALLRQKLPSFIEDVRKIVGPSKSEVVRCLNMDWFAY